METWHLALLGASVVVNLAVWIAAIVLNLRTTRHLHDARRLHDDAQRLHDETGVLLAQIELARRGDQEQSTLDA